MNTRSNQITKILLAIYLVVCCWILLFKLGVQFSYMPKRSFNLLPFDGFYRAHRRADKPELILNILIFIPLGLYFAALFRQWTWQRSLLAFFLTSLSFEAIQFIGKIGAFDVTDIITNTSGGLIGWMLFTCLRKLTGSSTKAQGVVNVICTLGTLFIITLLVLLKMDRLPIHYK